MGGWKIQKINTLNLLYLQRNKKVPLNEPVFKEHLDASINKTLNSVIHQTTFARVVCACKEAHYISCGKISINNKTKYWSK